jgi:hypothetical protein
VHPPKQLRTRFKGWYSKQNPTSSRPITIKPFQNWLWQNQHQTPTAPLVVKANENVDPSKVLDAMSSSKSAPSAAAAQIQIQKADNIKLPASPKPGLVFSYVAFISLLPMEYYFQIYTTSLETYI